MNRRPALVAAVLPLTLMLAACGGGDDKAATNPTSQGTSAAPSTGSSAGATDAPSSVATSAAPSANTPSAAGGGDAAWEKAVEGYVIASFKGAPRDFSGIGTCVAPKVVELVGPDRLAAAGTPSEYAKGHVNLGKLEWTRSEVDTAYDDLVACGLTPALFKSTFVESAKESGTPAQAACMDKMLNDDSTKLIVQSLFLGFTGDSATLTKFQADAKACAG